MKTWKKLAAGFATVIALVSCSALDQVQRQAIFSVERGSSRWFEQAPERAEMFDLTVSGGEKVHAWYVPTAAIDPAKAPTVLYLHGARWNLNGSVFRIDRYNDMGFNVLAIDYRGFGKSTARLPSEQSATEDALAGFAELERRQPNVDKRFVYGHSLGGAIAIDLATRPETQGRVAGLITEATFTSIGEVVRQLRYGWVPGLPWLVTQRFDSIDKVRKLNIPTLFVHGSRDRFIPPTMSQALFDAAAQVPQASRRLLIVEGGNHSGYSTIGSDTYRDAVEAFVKTAQTVSAAKAVLPGDAALSKVQLH
jgi:uncharacterized protein